MRKLEAVNQKSYIPDVGDFVAFRRSKSPTGESCGYVTFVGREWVHIDWPDAGVGKQLMVRRQNIMNLAGPMSWASAKARKTNKTETH